MLYGNDKNSLTYELNAYLPDDHPCQNENVHSHDVDLNITAMSTTVKGLAQSDTKYDGSTLRIAIVHARWNKEVIDSLVAGAVAKLKESGVKDTNIVIQSVPGSFELPLACSKCV